MSRPLLSRSAAHWAGCLALRPRTDANFANLSRVIAVIGPLLDQAPPSSTTGTANGEQPIGLDASRVQAQEIARELSALQERLKKSPAPLASREIEPQLAMLAQLIQGFGRVVRESPASERPRRLFARSAREPRKYTGPSCAPTCLWL